ncbi:MAG TPA: hypothetical protein DCM40_18170 [Maribacter sp.]|nr:hypothetical protein [Maribacter sp.]
MPKILSYFAPINIAAISLGIFVFSRVPLNDRIKRHETIHYQQQLELFFVGFYILYLAFWLIGLIKYRSGDTAYYEIPFEREARHNQHDENYLQIRKRFSWLRYLRDLF